MNWCWGQGTDFWERVQKLGIVEGHLNEIFNISTITKNLIKNRLQAMEQKE